MRYVFLVNGNYFLLLYLSLNENLDLVHTHMHAIGFSMHHTKHNPFLYKDELKEILNHY